MSNHSVNAAVLWTGGKDSVLALHEARKQHCSIRCLMTFAPPGAEFLAHPIQLMQLQANALRLPHLLWPVQPPFAEAYEAGLRCLREVHGVDAVITGDIAEVDGEPNWIRERSGPAGLKVLTPLWGRDRLGLLEQLVSEGFHAVFSCVKDRWMTPDWAGRALDRQAIAGLRALREKNGLDLCGEQGEYHTLVLDAPGFQRRVQLEQHQVCREESLAYLKIERATLQAKS